MFLGYVLTREVGLHIALMLCVLTNQCCATLAVSEASLLILIFCSHQSQACLGVSCEASHLLYFWTNQYWSTPVTSEASLFILLFRVCHVALPVLLVKMLLRGVKKSEGRRMSFLKPTTCLYSYRCISKEQLWVFPTSYLPIFEPVAAKQIASHC